MRPNPRISSNPSSPRFMNTTPAAVKSSSLMSEWFTMCRTVPRTASSLSPPSRAMSAAPTRIKPICDMDEQASVRFSWLEKSASTAPSTMVTSPRIRSQLPHSPSPGNRYTVTRRIPNTPAFVSIPDSSALAGAGATAWAFGSHT